MWRGGWDLLSLVCDVVVHHQVQFLTGVGLGDLLEEGQELLVPMPGPDRCGHLPGATSNVANRVVVPCRR
jgi:hypothetical protein